MSKIKVIICEDHVLFREGIKSYLNAREDIECVGEAENGAQLMFILKNKYTVDTFPDVVLLDINMPIMGGEETLQRLKQEYPDIKVIMLTMHNQVSMVEKMMSLGANSYVPKTEAADQIVKAILSVYGSNYYFNELINQALVQSVRKSRYVEQKEEQSEEPIQVVQQMEEVEEKPKKKRGGFFWAKHVLMGIGYGVGIALLLSIIVYVMLVISGNLSAMNSTTFNY